MKKSGLYITASFIMFLVTGCKKDYITEVVPPAYAKFATNVMEADYNILSDRPTEYKIPVGITNISGEARTLQLEYASSTGAAQGIQYDAPASITIPPGKALDTLRIKGIISGYDAPGREDNLIIKIKEGNIPLLANDSVVLTMQKACPINEAALAGVYPHSEDHYGVYTTEVKNIVKSSPDATTAEAYIKNVYNYGWDDIKVIFDWTDPANFRVTVPSQSAGGGYTVVSSPGKPGTFSSCNNSIKLILDIAGPGDNQKEFKVIIAK